MFRTTLYAALAATLLALPAAAHDGIQIVDPYARSAGPGARTGAVFMVIENHAAADDRLVSASSDAAERVELHTHVQKGDVMQMIEVPEGFAIPAGGSRALARGGDHVMLLGLTRPLNHGDTIALTLTFEQSGAIAIEVPVDLERKPDQAGGHGHGHGHGGMKHGGMKHGG